MNSEVALVLAPDGEALVGAARDLHPGLAARRNTCAQTRKLPPETIQALLDNRLFRLFRPRQFGGHEADPMTFFRIQWEMSAVCPSTGWVWGVLSAHDWQMALFPEQAQHEVWANQDAVIASSYAPVGKRVDVVPGGFRLYGKWDFCSGVDYADWCFLGGLVPGERTEYRTFLVPAKHCQIQDTWHVHGLQGTGSNSVVLDGAFVPEHRTHRMRDAYEGRNPGCAINTSPLYRLPFGQIFVRSISTPALGMTLGATAAFRALVDGSASSVSGKQAVDDPHVLEALAKATVEVEMLQARMRANLNEMQDCIAAGQDIPLQRRIQFKYESADVVHRCCAVVESLKAAAGAKGIFASSLLWQYHQDIGAARAHFGNNAPYFGRSLGAALLGRENQDLFL